MCRKLGYFHELSSMETRPTDYLATYVNIAQFFVGINEFIKRTHIEKDCQST